ncbi:hypothetical protein HN51_030368 [Arachis hypogaea]|uniref:RING-type E3 ubiquitin transferase n=1 Tax=Arachis hypogaea TaxID=3818 RepID=A0A445BBG5_ARAHY|nr:uncharacterized protein DS421_10g289770 [Arachis hypogaea]RYR36017.1 hypothetical protein Ahy_A10g051079 [Arachis hypogaea]
MDSISSSFSFLHPLLLNPSKTRNSPSNPKFVIFLFFFFFFSFFTFSFSASDSPFQSTYIRLCDNLVTAFPIRPNAAATSSAAIADSLRFQTGYFTSAHRLFNRSAASDYSKRLNFRVTSIRITQNDDVFELRGQILLQQRRPNMNYRRSLRKVYRGHRVTNWGVSQWIRATLRGFWSRSSGKLCMLGTGSYGYKVTDANVVLKLSYPLDLNVLDPLVSGTLESFDDKSSLNYFEPISILALSQGSDYRFTLVGNENGGCVGGSDGENLPLGDLSKGACTVFRGRMDQFELEYGSHCGDVNCNPIGSGAQKLPDFLYFYGSRCVTRRRVQMLLGFPDTSYHGFMFPFYPNTTLISEGVWDEKENRLCASACRILNFTGDLGNPYVGDCSIKLALRFPAVLSLRNRSSALGQIWSDKGIGDSGYFGKVGFKSSFKSARGLQGFQYVYTEIERVRKYCGGKMNDRGKGRKKYPDGYSSDMRFSMTVRSNKGQVAPGYSSPLFVGEESYEGRLYGVPTKMGKLKSPRTGSDNYSSLLNVSYTMSFNPPPDFNLSGQISSGEVKISAEGIYNRNTGNLCMTGCRNLRSNGKILMKNESMDCEIVINVQFSALNAKRRDSVKGTIESTRLKSDPYYFGPLQLSSSSIYTSQADASIWRMDFEIVMLLISNTLACLLVGLQLLHVRKHPEVLPYISVVMLLVITLGHMIPLILNFGTLFSHSQQTVFLGSEGWFQVNEVVVRMVTMIAFLLELRLLHLTWASRQHEGSQPGLWVSEKKVLCMTLPLYIGGTLVAWFVHIWKSGHKKGSRSFRLSRHRFKFPLGQAYQSPSILEDLKSYAGLLLDGFLLPQIIFNITSKAEGNTLASSFYVGTTIVRILPHAYDLYRSHTTAWFLDSSYIYANHRMGFYSTAWDIVIPCGGVLFAVLVYLQQRFGSRCILPKRFRESSVYEKVPAIGNDEL